MRIFVAGATGVLGRRVVRRLVDDGYDVTGLARTGEKAAELTAMGARAVTADLFDVASLSPVLAGHETALNLATHPPRPWLAGWPRAWREHERIRREGSRGFVNAALAGGAFRIVQESFALGYAAGGRRWLDERSFMDAAPWMKGFLDAEAQAKRFTDAGGVGVALRFGVFYGPDSEQTQVLARAARKGIAAMPGADDTYVPALHLDDAATAVIAALSAPAGVYNVTDDEPLTNAEARDALAAAVGRKRLRPVPGWAMRLAAPAMADLRSTRVSNRLFRETTGWAPAYPSLREGYPTVV